MANWMHKKFLTGKSLRQFTLAAMVCLTSQSFAEAQTGARHYPLQAETVPGLVGRTRLVRGGPVQGYFQPVEFRGAPGSTISPAIGGAFQEISSGPLLVGLQIGHVYRFRITQIPLDPGAELYPTIEVIDRLYPPEGQAAQFPIPIELTLQEMQYALMGKLVTRVIYVENPDTALPRQQEDQQRYYEVASEDDPLRVADELGRPVAILRVGSRLPDAGGPDNTFLYGSPPVLPLEREPILVEQAITSGLPGE